MSFVQVPCKSMENSKNNVWGQLTFIMEGHD
jgi:hypothetical protein